MVLFIKFKIISLIAVLSFLFYNPLTAYAASEPPVSAESCILMFADGESIFEKNADVRHLIASTTKIMTAILCIENCDLDDIVPIKEKYCQVEGSSMYLSADRTYTVKDLLSGLILASGNDAALALAEHLCGTEHAFVKMMNDKAKSLGMKDTSFANPHGLDAKDHYSTARDMARLMLYCMENETFRSIVGTYSATVYDQTYINHNKLLTTCPGCIGGKTGYTNAAGRCLVSCCERDGLRFVCVTLSDPDDWKDHVSLYNWAYDNFILRDVSGELRFDVPLISGDRKKVSVLPEKHVNILASRHETIEVRAELPQFVFAPVNLGETAGYFWVIIKEKVKAEGTLIYSESCPIAFPVLK